MRVVHRSRDDNPLGADPPHTPDSSRAGYVRAQNVYVEDLASGRLTQVTLDGGGDIINGTSDWVNQEEFGIRDGFRWSPDTL